MAEPAVDVEVDDGGTAVPVEPAGEPVDDRGVELRQQVAEYQRKYNESQAELNRANVSINQYQVALGNYRKQQTEPPKPDTASGYSEEDIAFVRNEAKKAAVEAAQAEGRRIMTQAEVNTAVTENPQLRKLAEIEYAKVLQDPDLQGVSEAKKQHIAVTNARLQSMMLEGEKTNISAPEPVRVNPAGSSLPKTRQAASADRSQDSPNADIDAYWERPESVEAMERNLRSIGHGYPLNINDPTIVNFGGRKISVKDLCNLIAVRAVRTGVNIKGVGNITHTQGVE